jgi:organic radical activating enzyme
MANLIESIKHFFSKKQPLPSGMISYQTPSEAGHQYRLHLRIEDDGTGILVINASTVLHLNQTAVEFAYHIIKETDEEEAAAKIARRYRISKQDALHDFQAFKMKIETMIETPDLDPVSFLGIERQEPYSAHISAPYRLDCALTYQVNAQSQTSDAPTDRVDRELSREEWLDVIQKALDVGIPHLLFTGGEPTLREDLPDLLAKAEELGLVTGLLTDGLKLSNPDYLNLLLQNGLDHLMVIFDPEKPKNWQTLTAILAEDLFTTVHLTLKAGQNLRPHIEKLAEIGANALSLSAPDPELAQELQDLRNFAAVLQLELVWDMPVPYSSNNPVSLELAADEAKVPEGAGIAWLYVEPDGDVLPAQGYNMVLGNILTDSWNEIWTSKQD